MKNHNEMYQSLLSRWDKYQEQKNKRLLARKLRVKKLCSGLAITAATVCGCMTLCFGGYAVWNYVVKPIVIEEKQPEMPVTTRTAVVTQTEKPAETTVTAVTAVSVTEAATEVTSKVTAAVTTTAEPVTEVYEQTVYTEPSVTTTARIIDASKEGIKIDVLDPDRYINITDEQKEVIESYKEFKEEAKKKSDDIFSMADLYTYRQGNELFQRYVKIDDYIGQNKIDALCLIHGYGDNPEDYIHIDYITDKGREDVEAFFRENDISTDRVEIKEMERSRKCEYIALNKVNQFIKLNELSCRIRPLVPTGISSTSYDGGIDITYDPQHEDDKKAVEEYITEHGYDTVLPIVYTLIVPTAETTDSIIIDSDADEFGRE